MKLSIKTVAFLILVLLVLDETLGWVPKKCRKFKNKKKKKCAKKWYKAHNTSVRPKKKSPTPSPLAKSVSSSKSPIALSPSASKSQLPAVSPSASKSKSGTGCTYAGHATFSTNVPWNQRVDSVAKSSQSDTIINWLSSNGGWGTGQFRIDFSITVLESFSSGDLRTFTKTDEFYSPDCDHVPFPVPSCGSLEGENGYACTNDGDCHLLVIYHPTNTLYEMWRANIGSTFYGGCAATWKLGATYPATLRGAQCTSADAGGFPISAMVFDADEIAAGSINHAIRFILPNSRIRDGSYVQPGTHSTNACSGDPNKAPPYGVRLRLKADYDISGLSAGAKVIATALKQYGMLLSDGGQIALTATSDKYTAHKWSEVGVDAESLKNIPVTAFEVVQWNGNPVPYTGDCVRNAI